MILRLSALFLIFIGITTGATYDTWAQAPGFADLTRPQQGEAIWGLATIEGSAAHPSFVAYELSFALDPNPTQTWFPITDPVQTPVTDGRLGIWDTVGITDGVYQVRLRVLLESGNDLEAIVRGLRVRNTAPTESPTPAPPATQSSPTPAEPTSTPRPTPIPIDIESGSSSVLRALVTGGMVGLVSLLLLGGYLTMRRASWIRRPTSQLHNSNRRSDRKRNSRARR